MNSTKFLGDQQLFGTLRFTLALMVVWYHLVDREFAGPIAVFGFYCLSGYLMTRVVNETYSDGLAGFSRYVANRALRIYPSYWFALAFGAVTVIVIPESAQQVNPNFQLPRDLVNELVIIGHWPFEAYLLPQSWSLAIELFYYLAIGAVLGRRRIFTVLWFVFALEVVAFAMMRGDFGFTWFYSSLLASSLPFATGAVIYHFRNQIPSLPIGVAAGAAAALVLTALLMPRDFGKAGGIYVGLAMAAVTIASLAQRRSSGLDDRLGDLAYPMFLLHYPAGAFALLWLGEKGMLTGAITALVALPFCWLSIVLVERPVRALRDRVRAPLTRPLPARTSSPAG